MAIRRSARRSRRTARRARRCRDELDRAARRARAARALDAAGTRFRVISRQSQSSAADAVASPAKPATIRRGGGRFPSWAQVAAALLFLGVSAGIANLDVRYDASGLSVRTGWSTSAPIAGLRGRASRAVRRRPVAAPVPSTPAPWRADLAALERQLTNRDARVAGARRRAARSSAQSTPS